MMDKDIDKIIDKPFQTPNQNRRTKTLGIRYSAIKNICKTPLSEIKKSNFSIKTDSTPSAGSPRTPLAFTENKQNESKSTGHLPSLRLSLKRKVLKKKRLEFVDNNGQAKNTLVDENDVDKILTEPVAKKRCDSEISLSELEHDEKHKKKVDELQKLICIWKEGFRRALDDLSRKLEPPREKADILELLNIPSDMIKFA